jgi:hypothetical protein
VVSGFSAHTANAVSSDGSVVVGGLDNHQTALFEAYRRTAESGTALLGTCLPNFHSRALAVSGDGSIIVGYVQNNSGFDEQKAFIWDQGHGMRLLQDVLEEDYNFDLSGWKLEEAWASWKATGISQDGSTIVGVALNAEGQREAWRAVLRKVVYVDRDATGANNGSSWANAYKYLQDALMFAVAGDEIRVAQGVYKPDAFVLSRRPNLGRAETFQLKNGVTLKGGYAGFREPDPNARDTELYETVLTGDRDGNDVDILHAERLIDEPTRAENSYHVVTGCGTDADAVLDGFTVTAGNANEPWPGPNRHGGGMDNDFGSPTVTNCVFIGNSARGDGGGLHQCNGVIKNNFIIGNVSKGHGAGLSYCHGVIQNNLILRNWANEGGGIALSRGTIQNNTIFGNWADEDGGGLYRCSAAIRNCIIWGNMAVSDGPHFWDCGDVTWSCIEGWVWAGEGNISDDPLFGDATRDDYHLKSRAGRWDPNSETWFIDDVTSPCIDAGDPMSPIGLEAFPNGGIVNMGAYGGTAEASKSYFGGPPCEIILAGDMNGDCKINFEDFRLMALHWMEDRNL